MIRSPRARPPRWGEALWGWSEGRPGSRSGHPDDVGPMQPRSKNLFATNRAQRRVDLGQFILPSPRAKVSFGSSHKGRTVEPGGAIVGAGMAEIGATPLLPSAPPKVSSPPL